MIIVKDCDDLLILETEKTLPQSAFTYLKLTNTTIVSVWVVIPTSKPHTSNFFCPPGSKKRNKSILANKKVY